MALYVYYRVPRPTPLRRWPPPRRAGASDEPRLMRRPDSAQGLQTWMEGYDSAAGEAEARIAAAMAAWVSGERHLEHFVPLA